MVGRAGDLLDKHFAARTAIRDFNQTMPLVLPTGFEMHRYSMLCVYTNRLQVLFSWLWCDMQYWYYPISDFIVLSCYSYIRYCFCAIFAGVFK